MTNAPDHRDDPSALAAIVSALMDEVLVLRRRVADLEQRAMGQPAALDDGAVLAELRRAFGDGAFTVVDLMRRVQLEDAERLRSILEQSTGMNGRRIGKLLSRLAGQRHGYWVLANVGTDRSGAIWCVSASLAANPQ